MIKHIFSMADLASILGKSRASVTGDIKNSNVVFSEHDEKVNRYSLSLDDIRTNLKNFGNGRKTGRIITIGNIKGGTGKTSIVTLLCSCLKSLGFRVLAVDCDKQGNLSQYFLTEPLSKDAPTLYSIFTDTSPNPKVVHNSRFENIDIIPSNLKTSEINIMRYHGTYSKLRFFLDELRPKYDFILIDTPPEVSLTLDAAICAADYVYGVLITDGMSLSGLDYIIYSAGVADQTFKSNVKMNACIFNLVNENRRLDRGLIEATEGLVKGIPVLNTRIPQFQTFKEIFVTRDFFSDVFDTKHIKLAFDLAVEVLSEIA